MTGVSGQTSAPRARTSWRGSLAFVCVSLALLLQSLAPPGYMAGSLDNGWPVVLCPEGLPSGFLEQEHHHHHDEGPGAGGLDLSLDGHCPLGSVFGESAAVLALNSSAELDPDGVVVDQFYQPPLLRGAYQPHRSRAPPVSA